MKKLLCIAAAMLLMLTPMLSTAYAQQPIQTTPVLANLVHNCPNTGVMLPEVFSPLVNNYLLTVASWVSRVTLTPFVNNPTDTVYINGMLVASGTKSQIINMTDRPTSASVTVTSQGTNISNTYTIFIQRRPSEKRTRVSSGYISNIYNKNNKYYIEADLVSVEYTNGNFSTFHNESGYIYKYACNENCIFYYGTMAAPIRAVTADDFMYNYYINSQRLYRIIYIEDEIVAVMPYQADY